MAVQTPNFQIASKQFAPDTRGLGAGIREAILGVRQGKAQAAQEAKDEAFRQEKQKMLGEGAIISSALNETDPEKRKQFIEVAAQKANPQFASELRELAEQPIEIQNNLIRAALIEDGLQELIPKAEKDDSIQEIRKETRGGIRKDLTAISKDANTISTNFNKLKNLSTEIETGNRQAVAQGLVALVKIGDPGSTVREGEMVSALNTQNPVAAMSSLLAGKNTTDDVINSVTAAIDPLNPTNVNINDFLNTANALVSANVPNIQSRYASAREAADTNLSEAGVKSLFTSGLEKSITGLSDLSTTDSGLKSEFQKLSPKQRKVFMQNATDEELKEAGIL